MTREEIGVLARELAPVVRAYVATAVAEQAATLQQASARLATLETAQPDVPALRDRLTRLETAAAFTADALQVLGPLRERVAAVETRPAVPGPPGPPGMGLDDYTADFDGERTVTLTLKSAAGAKAIDLVFPVPVYREVFRPGETYAAGDMVTWEGSTWMCRATTTTKPGEGDKAWRLAVKRGRDGKDAGR